MEEQPHEKPRTDLHSFSHGGGFGLNRRRVRFHANFCLFKITAKAFLAFVKYSDPQEKLELCQILVRAPLSGITRARREGFIYITKRASEQI